LPRFGRRTPSIKEKGLKKISVRRKEGSVKRSLLLGRRCWRLSNRLGRGGFRRRSYEHDFLEGKSKSKDLNKKGKVRIRQ